MQHTRIAILQPGIASYRLGFYERLLPLARDAGFDIEVFVGTKAPELAGRGDLCVPSYAQELRTCVFSIRGRHALVRSPVPVLRGNFDLVVMEQAVRNLESFAIVAALGRNRAAFWGHGRTYTSSIPPVQESLKRWLTRRGSWFFAYTPGGASAVIADGFEASRVTVLNNSVDTTSLSHDIEELSDMDRSDFAKQHDLTLRTALFIGGLDESKRLHFLLEAADRIHDQLPDFRLLVAGTGRQQYLVEEASRERPWLIQLGTVRGKGKALALSHAQAILMPGRVGLVAVDSFVAGTPIVTTKWKWHAPEFEYLQDGVNALITDDAVDSYAEGVVRLLSAPDVVNALRVGAQRAGRSLGVDAMAERFVAGLAGWRASQTGSS